MARGLASRDEARRSGIYFPAQSVHDELRTMLAKARKRVRG
jgi:hypothetical protein